MKDWRKSPERINYPTGLVVDRYTLQNPSGTLRIHVEQTVKLGRHCLRDDKPGDCSVDGTVIPRGATGLICHETLPVRTYRANWHGKAGALQQAMATAWKWYDHFLPIAAGNKGRARAGRLALDLLVALAAIAVAVLTLAWGMH